MKKTLLFALALMMVAALAVGCSAKDETAQNNATVAPVATQEIVPEVTGEATAETTEEVPAAETTAAADEAGAN